MMPQKVSFIIHCPEIKQGGRTLLHCAVHENCAVPFTGTSRDEGCSRYVFVGLLPIATRKAFQNETPFKY